MTLTEWDEQNKRMFLSVGLRVHKDSGTYDDKLYNRLYKRKVQQWIDEWAEGKDVDEGKKEFAWMHKKRLEELPNQIPQEIYNKIADIRVFALGYCTHEIKKDILKLDKENKKISDDMREAFDKIEKEKGVDKSLKDQICFHDSEILSIRHGKQLIIELNSIDIAVDKSILCCDGVTFLTEHKAKIGSHWLYYNLYRHEKGYEWQILFVDYSINEIGWYDSNKYEVSFLCKDISIETDMSEDSEEVCIDGIFQI